MLMEIDLAALTPSPTNPRKTFDPLKLEELARSIAEKGLIEPIVVRPQPDRPNVPGLGYEIVAGERRYRAAGIAGLTTVLCIVRELDDVQALEIQTIENLQRDDLHPLEEAEGFAALMKQATYFADEIARKIGKSEKYVYDRVKLLQLIPSLRKVFLDGEITAGHAILLARLAYSDQQRCLGEREGFSGGLFRPEHADPHPTLELDDDRARRKAVSVRELQTWIDDHVRFRPEVEDLPNLFPQTARALQAAQEGKLKVVHITHDYRVPDAARAKERTHGRPSWRRADGGLDRPDGYGKPKPSKPCDHSVLGVVVAGPGRGEAFQVCVAKKKCEVHWQAEMKEAANGTSPAAARQKQAEQERKWEEQRKREEAERARWQKAAPALLETLAAKLQETPAEALLDLVINACAGWNSKNLTQMERGATVEDGVRYAAFLVLGRNANDSWNAPQNLPKLLKPFGIDAKKIVDQVVPPPEKPKKEDAAKKAPGARARRRVKAEGEGAHVPNQETAR